jgi:hypothetical protein
MIIKQIWNRKGQRRSRENDGDEYHVCSLLIYVFMVDLTARPAVQATYCLQRN